MSSTLPTRPPYPSDVSDEEWAFVAPYLTWLPEDAGQRRHTLRGLQRTALSGARWHSLAPAAARLPALGTGLPAVPPLAGGWLFRDHGRGPALALAPDSQTARAANGGDPGQPHAAGDAGERQSSGIRR